MDVFTHSLRQLLMLNYTYKRLIAIGLLLLSLNTQAQSSVGEFELSNDKTQPQFAVLLNTKISGSVNGLIASINVEQTFQNNLESWVNGRYVFPLPEGAAVDSFRMRIGDRIINGLIKEKEQAKQEFNAAKLSGKKAGLLKQHRPNLFSISVANIGPNEKVVAELTFVNKVHFENNTFSLRLPTTITPRYIAAAPASYRSRHERDAALTESIKNAISEPQDVDLNTTTGWATDSARIIDTRDISPSQTHAIGHQASHHFSLSLSVNSGLPMQSIDSPTHTIVSNHLSASNAELSLANGTEKMNSDLLIQWQAINGSTPQAAFFQQKFSDAYYSMLMITPPQVDSQLSLPRDVNFVIDTSGSMSGTSMNQAKQALHTALDYLSPSDKFNITEFNSRYTSLFSHSQSVTLNRLNAAHAMIDSLHAGGGTEMIPPLQHVFNNTRDSSYLNQIIFITDGAISNESELFTLVAQNLNDSRLFMVGIGSAPNTYFMNKAAKFGRGTYTLIQDVTQVNKKMADLFEKITSPLMRDINVVWSQNQSVETYPSKIPDLYNGQPLTLIAKSSAPITQAKIQGHLFNTPWTQILNLNKTAKLQTENLDSIWARQKIAAIMDKHHTRNQSLQQTKLEVINLGIKHNIVTMYTSFIAIENTPSKPEGIESKQQNVPNLMPKGNTVPAPQTATPATLLCLIGLLLILLSYFFNQFTRVRQRMIITQYHSSSN